MAPRSRGLSAGSGPRPYGLRPGLGRLVRNGLAQPSEAAGGTQIENAITALRELSIVRH